MNSNNRNKYFKGNYRDFSQTKGYFIGRFMREKGFPTLETEEVEIAWKILPTIFDDKKPHFHKKGVEINIIISGSYKVWIEGKVMILKKGDFLVVYPRAELKNISAKKDTEMIV